MDFKRLLTTLCLFSMVLLFVQCEKEEILMKEAFKPAADDAQNPNAKKPDNPGKPAPDPEWAIISGDVSGKGWASTSVKEYLPFEELTLGDHFEDDKGTFDGEIRILYGTKKKSENRIDFNYTDSEGVPKRFIIRAETNTGAYNAEDRILNLQNCFTRIYIRDGTGLNFIDYTPASATVVFSDSP